MIIYTNPVHLLLSKYSTLFQHSLPDSRDICDVKLPTLAPADGTVIELWIIQP